MIGHRVEVLVEGPSKKNDTHGPLQLTGRTPTDHIAVFAGNPRLIGHKVEVDIDDASSFTLFCNVVTGEHIKEPLLRKPIEISTDITTRRWPLPLI